jgi:hypothetical protein
MTTHCVSSDDAQGAVRAYEALRRHVLAGANIAGDAALVLLLRQGVAGWMARRLACAGPPPAAACTSTRATGEEIHACIVRVLASMALAAQQEVCA